MNPSTAPNTRADDDRPHLWCVSAFRLVDLFREAAPAYGDRLRVDVINLHFESACTEIRRRMRTEPCDVLLSAGTNGEYLRSQLSVPVVSVRVGGFDVMSALVKARRMSERIAVVLHRSVSPVVEDFALGFGIDVDFRFYETAEEADRAIRQVAEAGVDVVVGAGLAVELAERAGLRAVFTYTLDGVRLAIEDALQLVGSRRAERARSTLLTTVLHHLSEGVVAMDGAGRLIAANPSAERLTGLGLLDAVGSPVEDILPALEPGRALAADRTELDIVGRIGGHELLIDRAPLVGTGSRQGAVWTLHPPAQVERAFSRLRAHRHHRSRSARWRLDDIVAGSPGMQALVERCRVIAAHSDATVVLHGPTGSGKELLAQGIHNASRRRRGPFVAVNCGAFAESLLESELFGYEEGAFTGARRHGKAGLFEAAHQGTLFLDEVAELPLLLQTRLLRVLQERQVTRVGGLDAVPVDVRIVAATHRDLLARVHAGHFREDLFYRLGVLTLEVPPLRSRREDLDVLATRLIEAGLARIGLQALRERLLKAALPVLRRHAWPGNVRELENVAERIVMACLERGVAIGGSEVAALLDRPVAPPPPAVGETGLQSTRQAAELQHVRAALAAHRGNIAATAESLGISRTTLWRKLKAAAG